MSNKLTNFIAIFFLIIMFLLCVFSIKDDSFTFDETAHIAAGYSYLTQKDMRLNPEHPPLIKDIAALPLLFLNLNFPKNHPSWTQNENPQWWFQFDFANQFLYKSGNNPDKILFWGRIPMILVLIFLGWFLFFWTKKLFNNKTAILTLFLFSFSPTLLAHGRLITTDVGAALGVVLSTYFWLKFLENPSRKNIILTGIIFGISMLFKFSLLLLIPFFGFITLVYAVLKGKKYILKYLLSAIFIGLIGLIFIILPVYQYHILNYPHQHQIRDTQFLLDTSSLPHFLITINKWLSTQPIFRSFSQYLLGILLVLNRGATGNTTYFLGQVSAAGWKSYFPIIYLIKEPLAFHILSLIALITAIFLIKKPISKNTFIRIKNWVENHFTEFSMITFLCLYWFTSINSKLNIGVRHLLPIFPFTIILVSETITNYWIDNKNLKIKYLILFFLLLWQSFTVISVFPNFLTYFNELAGGPKNGYLYAVDSNFDWGQDLKRLKKWIEENKIEKIYIDYFGGGDVEFYFGEKAIKWSGEKNPKEMEKPNYFAVSVSSLQGGRGFPAKGYDGKTDYYYWLYQFEPPIKRLGSIFVYYIK